MRTRRPVVGSLVAAAVTLILLGSLTACSSSGDSGGAASPDSTSTLVPSSTGDSCTDPTGDLDLPAGVAADTAGLSGVDLVSAAATVNGDQLDVTMTAAGPIDAAPAATYVVAQGDPLGALSFELRMVHGADGWTSTLITWPDAKETRAPLAITVKVDGATLTTAVPLQSLPPIALAMNFGASATVGSSIVIDDCSSLGAG